MPDVSAADQVAVVDAAIQAAELGLASLASVADKAPLLAPGAKRSETREADTREEAEIKQSTKVGKTFAERSAEAGNVLKQLRLWLRDKYDSHPRLHRWLYRIPVALLGVNLYYLGRPRPACRKRASFLHIHVRYTHATSP